MIYHAPTQKFVIEHFSIAEAASELRWAIRNIREAAGLPLTPYDHDGTMEAPQFAEAAILNAAMKLGIDLGAQTQRYGELDVSRDG